MFLLKKTMILVIFAFIMTSMSIGLAADKKTDVEANRKVIAACTKAITANPNNAGAYVDRGKAYQNINQLELALADYTWAIKLEPKNAGAYSARAQVYYDTKRYGEALNDYSSTIELVPQDMEAHFRRGVCYYYTGQYELGIGDLEQVTVLQPQHAGAYLVKGVCYQKLDRKEEAIKAYQSLLAHVPANKQTQEAITAAKKMLKALGVES